MTFEKEPFKIFVDRLKEGSTHLIEETVAPDFMDIHEKELEFLQPIKIEGEAYVADQDLVIKLEAEATAVIPCRICGNPVEAIVKIPPFYHHIPVKEVKGAIFLFNDILREAILLDTPHFAECGEGKCPARTEIARYLKQEDSQKGDEEGFHPFADIDLK